jgi:hypothetical protein
MGPIKLTGMHVIQEAAFRNRVREAVKLNQTRGDPTRGG